MLNCRIATTSDLSLMQSIISTPREVVLSYTLNRDPNQPQPPLYKKMKELYGSIKAFSKVFAFADTARDELGTDILCLHNDHS